MYENERKTELLVPSTAAEQGHAHAQSSLGWAYLNARGVPQDHAQAVHWYRKAADHGHANAQFALGKAYEYGKGVEQDYAQAVRWYREAAKQGDTDGQLFLGAAYFSGRGVPQDRVEAHKWMNLVASRTSALARIGPLLLAKSDPGLKRDSKLETPGATVVAN